LSIGSHFGKITAKNEGNM